ncbi:MAG: CRISPR-associated endonuclease Cas1 [Caldilineaceae bacterium]|nr:CRISPR-associated endonuclease Cas1 [Caldilineaceae bacterium]
MRNPLYLVEQGSKLTREGRRLTVTKEDSILARVAVLQVSQVIVFGNSQITTPALRLLLDENVEVVLLSERGRFYGRLVGPATGNGALRVAQVLCSRDAEFSLATAQACVRGKLHNLKVFLQRYARRYDDAEIDAAVARVNQLLPRVARTRTINSLMGVEGQATAIYFGVWKNLLKPPWQFDKRIRRPPTDPVNALLGFAYTLLLQNVLGAVLTVGLDPNVGFLHQLNYNRPSLALDLVEEFRPIIADSLVLRCLNNEIITPDHFETGDERVPVRLTQEGIRRFIREFETRLTQRFKHPVSGDQVTYRRLFHLQAYALAGTLNPNNHSHFYQPFTVR